MQPQTPPNPPSPGPGLAAPLDREATISARVERLAGEVERLHASLEHAQRLASLGTIASIIAHEFNNILTPVMSYAQMALANPHDQQLLVKSAQRSLDGAEKASQIAAAILEFARDEFAALDGAAASADPAPPCRQGPHAESVAGGRSPARSARSGAAERVDVLAAAHGALACLAREPAKDGIRLVLEVPDRLLAAMRPVALQQVLLNLILNARRSMAGTRGGTLTIRAAMYRAHATTEVVSEATGVSGGISGIPLVPPGATAASSTWNAWVVRGELPSGPWLLVQVGDTGCGMSSEHLARVFGAFVSGHSGSQHAAPLRGTGLGLTVCQRLVEQAGGTIWCTSQVSVGTEFTIALPASV